MKDTLFSGWSCQKLCSSFCLATLPSMTLLINQKNWYTDHFAAMKPVSELFNYNLSKYVAPSEFLTNDETLYQLRHQIAFRKYSWMSLISIVSFGSLWTTLVFFTHIKHSHTQQISLLEMVHTNHGNNTTSEFEMTKHFNRFSLY